MTATKTRATGSISVSKWAPTEIDGDVAGIKRVSIEVVEAFAGDIEGEGRAILLQAPRPDGSASFVGLEKVSATLAGRSGTFVFQDSGTLDATGRVEGTWFVVPGSGSGDLTGLRGEGGFTAAVGEHAAIHLDYWFE